MRIKRCDAPRDPGGDSAVVTIYADNVDVVPIVKGDRPTGVSRAETCLRRIACSSWSKKVSVIDGRGDRLTKARWKLLGLEVCRVVFLPSVGEPSRRAGSDEFLTAIAEKANRR